MVLGAVAEGVGAVKGALKAVVGTAVAAVGAISRVSKAVLARNDGSQLASETTGKQQAPAQHPSGQVSRGEGSPKGSQPGRYPVTVLGWGCILAAAGTLLLPLPRVLVMLRSAVLGLALLELMTPSEEGSKEREQGEKGDERELSGGSGGEAEGNAEEREFSVPTDLSRLTVIAEGTFAKVYRDSDSALKVMEGMEPAEVQEEFRLMRELGGRWDNILTAWDLRLSSTVSSFRMPLCQGTTIDLLYVHQRATGNQGLPEKWVVQILKQTAVALHECHINRVCHFDAKPDNILLTRFPRDEQNGVAEASVKLTDFGISLPASDLKWLTAPRGTRQYMAPEMKVWGTKREGPVLPIGYACDIYSLGCAMIELLSGVQEGGLEMLEADCSTETRKLLSLMTRENPRERITAAELLESDLLLRHPLLLQ